MVPPEVLNAALEGDLEAIENWLAHETTVVAARLFGSLSGFANVPKECFWRVVKYAWLGDWRRP